MTEKSKKTIAIIGGLVVCAALIWAISAQTGLASHQSNAPIDVNDTAEPTLTSDIHIDTQNPNNTKSSATASPIPNQTDMAGQVIQSDPVKPTETPDFTPTQEQLDSGEVPTGDYTPSVSYPPTNDAGEVFIPGFGYVPAAVPGRTDYLPDMYENGNKVGTMD